MLVLTRKPGEQIMIGDGIVITVLEGRGEGVRIGIEAPRGVSIQRREVIEAIAAANLAAIQSGPGAEEALRGLLPPAPSPDKAETGDADTSTEPEPGHSWVSPT